MKVQGKVWGVTHELFNLNNVEIHHIEVEKGGFCSKHYHQTKYNRFIVLDGHLKITTWRNGLEDITYLFTGQECTVPPGEYHMFEALQDTTALEVYWVELKQNDIVRTNSGGKLCS